MRTCLLCLGISFFLLGCGSSNVPDLNTVEGTVTMDGKPLPNAQVIFSPTGTEGGRPAAAITDEDGYYQLEYSPGNYGATPGAYRVSISTASSKTDEQGNDVPVPETVPAKYNVNSELEVKVPSESGDYDFKLDSDGPIIDPGLDGEEGGESASPVC